MPIVIEIPSVEEVRALGNGPESRDLDAVLVALEAASRSVEAVMVAAVEHGDRTGAWGHDGHRSATPWVTAVTGCSRARAVGRVRVARFAELGLERWVAAVADASLGIDQAAALGRVAANPRVRAHLADSEALLLELARTMPFKAFKLALDHWERLADQDGALADHDAADRSRSLSMGFVGNRFVFTGSCGASQGAVIEQLLRRFIEAEFRADVEAAAVEGREPVAGELRRTAGQRALDALVTALEHGASSDRNTVSPVINLVVDTTTVVEWVRYGIGGPHPVPDPAGLMTRRCESSGGGPLDPRLLLETILSGRIRSVILSDDHLPRTVSSSVRFFDRNTREAIRALDATCYWPGCELPAEVCDIDHLTPHSRGGPTTPANAGAACRGHNRFKSDRWYASRRRTGWQVRRPDGTTLADAPPRGPTPVR
ncbi:MAG: DUF222 domain-containing protein [Ilumatobacteraceae bacterium]|jgi:hypothetical protein